MEKYIYQNGEKTQRAFKKLGRFVGENKPSSLLDPGRSS